MQKVLLDLDMQPIRDNQAKKLSGGQKRRLSVGIAVLGNPKVRVSSGSAFMHEDVNPFGGSRSCGFGLFVKYRAGKCCDVSHVLWAAN